MAEKAVVATVEGIISKQGNISGQSDDDLDRQGYEELMTNISTGAGAMAGDVAGDAVDTIVKPVADRAYRMKKFYGDVSR